MAGRRLAIGRERLARRGRRRGGLRRRHGRGLGQGRAERSSWCGPRPSRTTCTACWPRRPSSPAAVAPPATRRWWRASSACRRCAAPRRIEIDLEARHFRVGDVVVREGDMISVDGTTGEVFLGEIDTEIPDLSDPDLSQLLGLGRRLPPPGRVGQRRLSRRRPAGAGVRRRGHRAVPHRAHVLRAGAAAHRARDDPGRRSAAARQAALDQLLPIQRERLPGDSGRHGRACR